MRIVFIGKAVSPYPAIGGSAYPNDYSNRSTEPLEKPQVSLETVPSIGSGEIPRVHRQAFGTKQRYNDDVTGHHKIIQDLADQFRVPVKHINDRTGVYFESVAPANRLRGDLTWNHDRTKALTVNPLNQILLSTEHPNMDDVHAYSAALGHIYNQDSVGILKPNWKRLSGFDDPDAEGTYYHVGRDIGRQPLKELTNKLQDPAHNPEFYDHDFALVAGRDGFHVLHFGDKHHEYRQQVNHLVEQVLPKDNVYYHPYFNDGEGLVFPQEYFGEPDAEGKTKADAYIENAKRNGRENPFQNLDSYREWVKAQGEHADAEYFKEPDGSYVPKHLRNDATGDNAGGAKFAKSVGGTDLSGGGGVLSAGKGVGSSVDPHIIATLIAGGMWNLLGLPKDIALQMLLRYLSQMQVQQPPPQSLVRQVLGQ